jgi:phosphomannomutase/phosphoglucomutase
MQSTVFREYDIRGIVGTQLCVDRMYQLGQAIAYYLNGQKNPPKTMVIGIDGRVHSPLIAQELTRALVDSGLQVTYFDLCTSPVISWSVYSGRYDAGCMITASHNPPDYNGIKIFHDRKALSGTSIKTIGALFEQAVVPTNSQTGAYIVHDGVQDYVAWFVEQFNGLRGTEWNMVIDCANAVGGVVLPRIIDALELTGITLLYPEVDSVNAHHQADPTVEENIQALRTAVLEKNARLGIGLDGDADRMAAITDRGTHLRGDELLAIFIHALKDTLTKPVIIDIKCSQALVELLQLWSIPYVVTPTGSSYIRAAMREHESQLAGELSCHFFFADRSYGFDDGIYAAFRLLEIMHSTKSTLEDLHAPYPRKYSTPELRVECPEDKKSLVIEHLKDQLQKMPQVEIMTLDGVRATIPGAWGIVRASNTQAMLGMRFEGDTPEKLIFIKKIFAGLLSGHVDISILA